jgi:hypothetical protein
MRRIVGIIMLLVAVIIGVVEFRALVDPALIAALVAAYFGAVGWVEHGFHIPNRYGISPSDDGSFILLLFGAFFTLYGRSPQAWRSSQREMPHTRMMQPDPSNKSLQPTASRRTTSCSDD